MVVVVATLAAIAGLALTQEQQSGLSGVITVVFELTIMGHLRRVRGPSAGQVRGRERTVSLRIRTVK